MLILSYLISFTLTYSPSLYPDLLHSHLFSFSPTRLPSPFLVSFSLAEAILSCVVFFYCMGSPALIRSPSLSCDLLLFPSFRLVCSPSLSPKTPSLLIYLLFLCLLLLLSHVTPLSFTPLALSDLLLSYLISFSQTRSFSS
jgi:hypothetical protein